MMIIQGVKMALKFRGNSQIRDASINLSNIKDVQAGTIIGRPSGIGSGSASSISGENVRINSGLHTTDNVEFSSATLNGNLSILDSNESQKFSVDSDSGNTIVQGTLDSKGAFSVGNDQLTVQSDGTLATNSSISATGALDSASASFGSVSNGVYDGGLNAGASNLASATVHGALSHGGTDSNSALSSAYANISGGSISSTPISGSTGSFTTIEGSSTMNIQSGSLQVDGSGDVTMTGDLTVSGNLDILGTTTTIDTQQLVVEDSLFKIAANNNSTDSKDIGLIGQYASTSGGSSDGDDLGDSWSDVSSDDFSDGGVDYNYSATYSSSYGGSAKLAITQFSGGSGNNNRSKMARDVDATGGNLSQSGNYQLKATINFPDLNGGSFSGRIAVWDYGTTSFGTSPDKYQSFGSGSLTSGDEVTLTFTVDNDMANGVVLVVETWGGGSFGGIYVSDVHLTDPSGSTIFHQDGFEGSGGSSSTSKYWSGLVRDASDSDKKWHLFQTSENLDSDPDTITFTSGAGYSVATLVANTEGDVTGNADSADAWSSSRTVTFGTGDVTGSFSIDGSANVSDVDLTIEDSSVTNSMLGGSIAIGKINFLDTSAALGTSNDVVPSQAAVKSYVDAAVSSGGLTDLEVGDMQMVHSDGGTLSFTKVKEIISKKTVSSDDQTSGYISLSTEVESAFENKSQVYLNGQKLRYSSDTGTNNDYWFTASDAGATRYSNALTASDAASSDFFGSGVGLSNDGLVLAVGASRWEGDSTDQGGVYIYDWDSDNEEWDQRGSVLTAPDAEASDRFGESTSLNSDGTIMATGAMFWDSSTTSGAGAAYVFEYSDSELNDPSKYDDDLTASDEAASDQYGRVSISQDGNVLAVGALLWDKSGGSNQGGVYIYDWDSDNDQWSQRGDVISPTDDATNNVRFGTSTSLSSDGTYLAVGAILYSDTASGQGGAYVYKWNSSTNSWDKQGLTIVAGDAGADDHHANVSISSDGTILAVGSTNWDASGGSNEGAVYIYDWDSGDEEWDQRSYESGSYNVLTAEDSTSGDQYGRNVSLSSNGEILFIGSPNWDGDESNQGGVYIYDWSSSQDKWVQRGDVLESNSPSSSGKFGFSLETDGDGDVLLVTEYFANSSNNVQIFDWNSSTSSWDYRSSVSDPSNSSTGNFGYSLSINSDADKFCIGDVGDGSSVAGKVYTYSITETAAGWSQKGSTLSHPSPTQDDYHTHVSISGNGLVLSVGVYCYDGDAGANQGATFVYDWDSRIEDWILRTYGTIDETTYSETDFINDYDSNYGNTAGPIEYLGDGIVLCGSSGGSNCKVYRSTDNGENWTSALSLSGINYVAGIKHIGSGIVLVTTGGHSADGDVYRSTDYGQNWTNVSNDASHDNTMHVEYLGDGICVFGSGYNPGDGFVYRSTDSGATWAKTDTDNDIFGSGSDASGSARTARFKYLGGGICLGLRYTNHSTGQWRVIRSTDYGATWADIAQTSLVSDTPCHPVVEDLGGGRVLLLHPNLSSSSMYVSTDYGQTFETDSVFTVSTRLRELKHIGNNRVLTSSLTSSAGGGELYESTDGGDNWNSTAIFDPGMKSIVDFTLDYDKNTILVAGEKDNGSATVYVLGDDSGADNSLIPADIAASDFYGRDTSLSNDGSVLIVGSAAWEGDTTNQGSVYVYDWNSSSRRWIQRSYGDDIVSNGTFASNANDWSLSGTGGSSSAAWSSDHGGSVKLIATSGNWGQMIQTVSTDVLVSGKTYKLKLGVHDWEGGSGDGDNVKNIKYGIWPKSGSNYASAAAHSADYGDINDEISGTSGTIEFEFTANASMVSDEGFQIGIFYGGLPTSTGYIYIDNVDITDEDDMTITDGSPVLETAGSEAANDYFGFSCQINSDATIMVVSKYQLANGGGDEGEVEIYDWNSSTNSWDLRLTISNPYGSSSGTKNQYAFGYKVSIDGDGDVLTIAERGSGYNNFAGRVQTYSISTESTRDKINFNSGTISENDKLEIRYFIKS